MAFMDDGNLSPMAKFIIDELRTSDWSGHGVEHPCYSCNAEDECKVRAVQYHDNNNRYITLPKNPRPLFGRSVL